MTTVFSFGRFELRLASREFLRDGQPVALGARAFDVLQVLVERRERVVTKHELLDLAWPGVVVEENNLQVQISTLRKVLGPQSIATIPGRGYRLTVALDGAPERARDDVGASPFGQKHELLDRSPPLFGRDDDLVALRALLAQYRLVTVTGVGGVGKSRLAYRLSAEQRDSFEAGVVWVELAALSDSALVSETIAGALGVLRRSEDACKALVATVSSAEMLITIDNAEHLSAEVARVVQEILKGAPRVRILVTSQISLRVAGERVYRLQALAVPEPDSGPSDATTYGAVELFVDRARAADRSFKLSYPNVAAVISICRQLDGVPLAIELAAARVALLGAPHLARGLGERLRLLTSDSPMAPGRQQSLRAAFEWSHGMLTQNEQIVFRRVAIFAGGFSLELAQDVGAERDGGAPDEWAVVEALGTLVDRSLVVAQGGDTPRYALLETTRAFALEKLLQADEQASLAQRHARAMLVLFERGYEDRFGEQGNLSHHAYIDRLAPEINNLRAAFAWAKGRDGSTSLAIALATVSARALSEIGLTAEGLVLLGAVEAHVTSTHDSALVTRFWCSMSHLGRDGRLADGKLLETLELAEQGCRKLGWQRGIYSVMLTKTGRLTRRAELTAAQSMLAAAKGIERPEWPGWLRSDCQNNQFFLLLVNGMFEEALAVLEFIGVLLPPRGEERRRAQLTLNRAVLLSLQQQWVQAASLLEKLIDDSTRDIWQASMSPWAYAYLVLALTKLGKLVEAQERVRDALPLWRAEGIVNFGLQAVIRLAVAQGRAADAMRLTGAMGVSVHDLGRSDALALCIRGESQKRIEAESTDVAQRERWRSEGEALDEPAIAALCLGEADASSDL